MYALLEMLNSTNAMFFTVGIDCDFDIDSDIEAKLILDMCKATVLNLDTNEESKMTGSEFIKLLQNGEVFGMHDYKEGRICSAYSRKAILCNDLISLVPEVIEPHDLQSEYVFKQVINSVPKGNFLQNARYWVDKNDPDYRIIQAYELRRQLRDKHSDVVNGDVYSHIHKNRDTSILGSIVDFIIDNIADLYKVGNKVYIPRCNDGFFTQLNCMIFVYELDYKFFLEML